MNAADVEMNHGFIQFPSVVKTPVVLFLRVTHNRLHIFFLSV